MCENTDLPIRMLFYRRPYPAGKIMVGETTYKVSHVYMSQAVFTHLFQNLKILGLCNVQLNVRRLMCNFTMTSPYIACAG